MENFLPGGRRDVLLKDFTTFRIGGKARYFFVARTKEELVSAVKAAKDLKIPFFVLGAGSNLLVSDKGFEGLVIKIQYSEFDIKDSKIRVGAGLTMGELVNLSLKNSLGGMEWMAGIPGTLGGAVRGNAGAFGLSMQDIVESVEALDVRSLRFVAYGSKKCKFAYRESVFKKDKNLIVLAVTLKLEKEKKEKIGQEIKEYLNYRKSRHPREPSAGSVFKNVGFDEFGAKKLFEKFPQFSQFEEKGSVPAAFLIAECGLKGKKIGGAVISEKHSNFILNYSGRAKATDVKKLIELAKRQVKEKFKVKIKEEIQYLGI